jgi:alpha-L-arabinofuranosidase
VTHRCLFSLSLVCILGGNVRAAAARDTDIAITTTVEQSPVQRFGINLGGASYYDSGQMMKNLVFANPGFEGQIYQSTVRCAVGSAESCETQKSDAGWQDGFWDGARFEFFYGAANARTGTVSSYTAAKDTATKDKRGGVFTFSEPGPIPTTGDYMIVRKTMPGSPAAGWMPAVSGGGSVTAESTDLPQETEGKRALRLAAPAGGQASISTYFDTLEGHSFLRLNGAYELRFRAKGIGSGSSWFSDWFAEKPSMSVVLQRQARSNIGYIRESVKLNDGWKSYTLRYTASEAGTEVGPVMLQFSALGDSAFLLDDISLTQENTDPNNTTQFRDAVVNTLKTLRPGVLRFWAGQLGQTLDNLLAPPFGRQRSGFSAWYQEPSAVSYGLQEFLELCEAIGADPWFVVPTTFSTTEAADLVQYLAGSPATRYGALRAARGHSAKWTDSFHKIHLEFGNEAWNAIFKGGVIEYPEPYGNRAQQIFKAMRDEPSFRAPSFDLVLGGQADWPGRNNSIQNNCNNNDSFAIATYMMGTVNNFSTTENLFGPTFAEPEAFTQQDGVAEKVKGGGMLYLNHKAIQTSTHPVPLEVYETNLSTVQGTIPQSILNHYVTSLGAGLAVADNMLLDLRQFGIITQNLFTLPQYRYKRSDGKTAFLWGAVVDMGNSDRKRPQYLALELLNQAVENGATMLKTVHSGADPTWDQPLENTVQLKGAHYLQSFAFADGDLRSIIVFNLARESTLRVTFSGTNAPSGSVEIQQLTSANITDTNEDAQIVDIRKHSLTDFNPTSPLPLPPYSMTVLHWRHALTEGQSRP